MSRYSFQPNDRIFVKGMDFLSFTKNIGNNIGKGISKYFGRKYSKKFLNHDKNSSVYALNTASKRAIKKTAEATAI